MSRIPALLAAVLCVFFSGCAVTQEAINTAEVAAAGTERYIELSQKAFDGTIDPEKGLLPVTSEEWAGTPKSVRTLVERLLGALDTHRYAFYSISFQLNSGPDPSTLNLAPVIAPDVPEDKDENDDILTDPPENE